MSILLSNHANSAWILSRVWNRQPEDPNDTSHKAIVIRGMVHAFNRDQSILPRLLDISQMTLKSLTTVLHQRYATENCLFVLLFTVRNQQQSVRLLRGSCGSGQASRVSQPRPLAPAAHPR